jgi:hypothetical protein
VAPRVRTPKPESPSAADASAGILSRSPVQHGDAGRLTPIQEQVIDLQRSAGNRAVTTVIQRQAGGGEGFRVISQVWQVAGRDIVVVATGHADQVLFFYRRTGKGKKGAGVVVPPGKWAPFKTLMAQDESILKGKANPNKAWINKQPYYSQVAPDNPLRGYGNVRNQQVGAWLDNQSVAAGQVKDWQTVEQEMDQVANKYRQSVRGGGPGGAGAGGAGAGGRAGTAEVKGTAAEAKAVGAEAKAVGAEAKVIKAEVAAVEVIEGAAKATKAARIGRLLMALALPGPQDVFFLFLSAFASIAEAKAKLRADAYALGFAQGLAAVVTWQTADEARDKLMYKVATPSIGERVAGFEGVREAGTNEGVAAGWKFGNALTGDQRKGFRRQGLAATGLPERRRYSRDNLIDLGVALKPTVVELLAEAARQEQAKLDAERAKALSHRRVTR